MTKKEKFIEQFTKCVNDWGCFGDVTCSIVDNTTGNNCEFCPLDIRDRKNYCLGMFRRWKCYTKKSLLDAIDKLKELPSSYFTKKGFNRVAFDKTAKELVIK